MSLRKYLLEVELLARISWTEPSPRKTFLDLFWGLYSIVRLLPCCCNYCCLSIRGTKCSDIVLCSNTCLLLPFSSFCEFVTATWFVCKLPDFRAAPPPFLALLAEFLNRLACYQLAFFFRMARIEALGWNWWFCCYYDECCAVPPSCVSKSRAWLACYSSAILCLYGASGCLKDEGKCCKMGGMSGFELGPGGCSKNADSSPLPTFLPLIGVSSFLYCLMPL